MQWAIAGGIDRLHGFDFSLQILDRDYNLDLQSVRQASYERGTLGVGIIPNSLHHVCFRVRRAAKPRAAREKKSAGAV